MRKPEFVFATWIVQSLLFSNPKFPASILFLRLYRPVCVRPGQNLEDHFLMSWLIYVKAVDILRHKHFSCDGIQMSHLMRKPTIWFSNRSDTNQAVQRPGVVTGSESKSGKVSGPGLQDPQTPFYPMNLLGFVSLSSLQLKVRIKFQELAQLI